MGLSTSLCLTLTLSNCTLQPSINSDVSPALNQPLTVVRIGHQPHGAPLLVKAQGTLEKRLASMGIAVQWTEFPAGLPILEAMGKGEIDIGYAGVVPPLVAQAKGVPFVYVAHDLPAPHTIGILVQQDSPIQTLADLKGKKISTTKASAGHYLLIQALFKAGLSLEDVELVDLPPPKGVEAFKRGKVDAWIGWNPFLAELQGSFPARLLADSKGLMNDRNFYVATPSFANNHYNTVQVIIDEMRQGCRWINEHPTEATELVYQITKKNFSTVQNMMTTRRYQVLPIQDRAIEDQQRVAETFFRLGLLPTRIWVEDTVWKRSLEN